MPEDPATHIRPTATRPRMPEGYGIAKSPPGPESGSWPDVEQKLAESRNYWIASAGRTGTPHAMPVWGVVVDGIVLFGTDPSSRKGRNLAASPKVSVHLESGDDVVIIDGTVEEVTDREVLSRFVDAFDAKYQVRLDTSDPGSLVYAVRPRAVLTWLERDFPNTATRWSFAPSA